jgi:hypothetical protein
MAIPNREERWFGKLEAGYQSCFQPICPPYRDILSAVALGIVEIDRHHEIVTARQDTDQPWFIIQYSTECVTRVCHALLTNQQMWLPLRLRRHSWTCDYTMRGFTYPDPSKINVVIDCYVRELLQ